MPDEAESLRRYIDEQSEEAFADLVRRHLNLVYFAALRQVNGDAHRAEDVTQLVFARLASKAATIGRRSSIAGWLYLTTRHEAAHVMRTERRRNARESEAQAMNEILQDSERPIDWDRIRPVVDEVLGTLSEKERELVLLRYFEDTPFAEIGALTGTSADAARFRLDRTLERMRIALAKRGLESTAAAIALALASQAAAKAPAGLATAVIGKALSTAGSAVGPSGVLQLMSTSKITLGLAVLAGLLGAGFSVEEGLTARGNDAAIAAADRDYQRTLAEVEALRSDAAKLKGALSALQTQPGKGDSDATRDAASTRLASGASAGRPTSAQQAEPGVNWALSANPDVRSALSGWIKGSYSVVYGPLFKSMNLSASQIESLENLMLQENINMGAAGILTLRPEGMSSDDAEQAIHTFLGDANYQQLNQYKPVEFVQEVAMGLAGNLYDTDTPLTPQQAQQLTQILSQNSTTQPGRPPFPGNINWDAALPQAQGVLSDQQFSVLKNEVTVLTSQPGLWGAMNPINPGSIGRTQFPPPAFFSTPSH